MAPLAIALLIVFVARVQAAAQTTPGLSLEIVVEQIVVRTDQQGVVHRSLERASSVRPGDELLYTVRFTNTTDMPLQRPVIVMPLPSGVRYVIGSAVGPGAAVSFSIDGGASWGIAEELQIASADGTPAPARPEHYSHIRWKLEHDLAPGARGYLRFRGRMQ